MNTTLSKIIVIDNDVQFHSAYQTYFESFLEYSLMGIYTTVENALADYDSIRPDIVFSEVELPDTSGIEVGQY